MSAAPPRTGRIDEAAAQPPVRGERFLRLLDAGFARLERLTAPLPSSLNPLTQTGAVANVALLVAIASGILLLFWYTPSVTGAHQSLEAIRGDLLAQGVRSLHRYSSDAAMLFILLHALRSLAARQVGGARTLAWITGIVMVAVVWLIGWLGYWLVWDERGYAVAAGTARAVDALPIVADPLSRSLLTDQGLNSLLFFMIFFLHMLMPLLVGIALWLHIARLSRANILPSRRMAAWVVGSMVVLSLVVPATSAGAATMSHVSSGYTMDWWYLLPVFFTDRLGGGALWLGSALLGAALVSVPFWIVRRGRAGKRRAIAAQVDPSKCNACRQCVEDCPYGAIQMVPRTDGKKWNGVAEVDPGKCVGCGVCAGACNSAGIGLPWIEAVDVRHQVDAWLRDRPTEAHLAFVCAESAGARMSIDPVTGTSPDLPGYQVVPVPCAGWVHVLSVERALRRGARSVLIAGCPAPGAYREGSKWTAQRLAGQRGKHVDVSGLGDRVRLVTLARGDRAELAAIAERHRKGVERRVQLRTRARIATVAGGAIVALGLATWLPSDLGYASPATGEPELVVSFKHPGQIAEQCRTLTEAELADKPAHMRRPVECTRERSPVRMRILVDGAAVVERSYRPSGLFNDGASIAIERLPVSAGTHTVRVEIADRAGEAWAHQAEKAIEFTPNERRVVLFDKTAGFSWF